MNNTSDRTWLFDDREGVFKALFIIPAGMDFFQDKLAYEKKNEYHRKIEWRT